MATSIRVTHITRPENSNIHAHITKIWSNGIPWTLEEAIMSIKLGVTSFYVTDANGEVAIVRVIPKSNSYREHLRTWADGLWKDNLLNLPRKA